MAKIVRMVITVILISSWCGFLGYVATNGHKEVIQELETEPEYACEQGTLDFGAKTGQGSDKPHWICAVHDDGSYGWVKVY